MNLYREESSNAKWNAQRNLQGRTHYVDDETLRFHHSRVLATYIADKGLIFALIESCALDMNNTRRGYRPVIFDVFGHVIERPKLSDAFSSRRAAEKSMWNSLNSINAGEITLRAIEQTERYHADEMKRLRDEVARLTEKAA